METALFLVAIDNEFMRGVKTQISQLPFPGDSKELLDKYREDIKLIIEKAFKEYESIEEKKPRKERTASHPSLFKQKEQPLDEKVNEEGQKLSKIKPT